MRFNLILLTCLAAGALALPLPVAADDGAADYARAREQLARAEFAPARASLEQAVRASDDNKEYRQQLAMLRQVMELRERIGTETDAARWEKMYGALRAYYYDFDLFGEAAALDRVLHARAGSPASGEALAETLLQLGANAEARAVLTGLAGEELTAKGRRLKALCYARTGGATEAEHLLSALPPATEANPELLYLEARVRALIGASEAARGALQAAFRATAPSALERLKARARACPDFAALAGDAAFTAVFSTASTVPESSCSRGASCGGCPRATSCASGAHSGK